MKVIRASASYSRTISPAPYESKVAKAEIEYSFAEDETISGEQALQIAMTAAVAQVHLTLGLAVPTKIVVGGPPLKIAVPEEIARIDGAVQNQDGSAEAAPKATPTRGRPKKNANPSVPTALVPGNAEGTVATGAAETQAAAPEAQTNPAPSTVAPPTGTGSDAGTVAPASEIITDGDLVKACSLTTARLREAGDATGAQKVKAARDAVIGQPGQAVISMPQAKRAGFIAALKELK